MMVREAYYAPTLNEGPFPEHYEPFENPITNPFSKVKLNPAVQFGEKKLNVKGDFEQTFRLLLQPIGYLNTGNQER